MEDNIRKRAHLIESFNAAIEGFFYVVKSQRNMRIHFLVALFVLLLGIYLNFLRIELILLCITVSIVLITEMINTAVEILLDYIHAPHSHWVKRVKDISAGSVLIAALNAVIVGYFLFIKNNTIYKVFNKGLLKVGQSDWHISFFILLILLGIVIFSKALFHKGTPLRGGMPSGHSAVAFSVWTLVALISGNSLLTFAVFILAFLVAQSRIGRHYHNIWEVLAGGAIGITLTVMVFRILVG